MNIYLAFALVVIVSYLLGNINFSRIVSKYGYKKDLSKMGSGNMGTMNVLRNLGFVAALVTLLAEVVKAGLCCYISRICMNGYGYGELAFYVSGFSVVIGGMYPIIYNFKGGKGIAAMGGIFLFSRIWWVGLIMFTIGIIQIVITDMGVVSSMIFIIGMSIATTVWAFLASVPYAWLITVIVWVLTALSIFKHRGNLERLFKGKENGSNFKKAFKKLINKNKSVQTISEDEVDATPEAEIIIEAGEESTSQTSEETENIDNKSE